MTIEAFAPAKVNLTLHITDQRADGYHLLDSLVVFANVGDRLTIKKEDEVQLSLSGPYTQGVPDDHRNIVVQAAQACALKAHISLEKNLPNAAGIGGGSADAAALIRAARKLGHQIALDDITRLGADVPVCLSSSPQRMQSIGEILSAVPAIPPLWMVLVNPGVDVPTGSVFKALPNKQNAPMKDRLPIWPNFSSFCQWLGAQRNDLEAPALCVEPKIQQVLTALSSAEIARMSGSGATCFGLFPNIESAQQTAQRIKCDHPEWWVCATNVMS